MHFNATIKLAAILCCLTICYPLVAHFNPVRAAVGQVAPRGDGTKDGAPLVDEMVGTANNWRDYTCASILDCYKGDQVQRQTCNFLYKDKQVRVEVTGGGFRDGSIIVKRKDGTVRA